MRWFYLPLVLLLVIGLGSQAAADLTVLATSAGDVTVNMPGTDRDGQVKTPDYAGATLLDNALSATAAGDTLYAHTGTYDDVIVHGDWANNVWLIGAGVDSTFISRTNSGNGYAVSANSAASTGGGIKHLTITGDNNTGKLWAFEVSTASNFTIDTVNTSGNLPGLFVAGAGFATDAGAADTLTVQNCNFVSTADSNSHTRDAAILLSGAGTVDAGSNITFSSCTFDLDQMDVNTDGFKIEGVDGFYLRNCTIDLPRTVSSAASYGISVRGYATDSDTASDIEISDCTITAQEGGAAFTSLVTISIGRVQASEDGIVDDVLIERNYISVPPLQDYSGIKCEVDYTGTPGQDATHSDNIRILNNTVVGAENGIGFHENTRFSIMAHNRIIGPGVAYTTRGINIEDARKVKVFSNLVSNYEHGINITDSGNASPGFFNSEVEVLGNVMAQCTNALHVNDATGVTDSIMYSADNIAVGCTNFWRLDSAGAQTLAQWQALAIPNLAAGYYGSEWIHAQGDIEYESYPAALRLILSGAFGRLQMGVGHK